MPLNWRQATPLERGQWARWVDFFEGRLSKSVVSYHLAANIAADTQSFLGVHDLTHSFPPVFTLDDEQNVISLLNQYNTLGRLLIGVHSAKYGIRIAAGDIDILAPPGMPSEEYQGDLYELGAIPLIIWAIAAGAVLVSGLWAGSQMMKSAADRDFVKYKTAILNADKAMMKQPPDIRSDWIKRRKEFEQQEQQTKKTTGFLVDIFGSKIGGGIAAAGVVLIALLALRFVPKAKRNN